MKPRKLLVFANDPLKEYFKKGELSERYFNPGNFFDEVSFISLSKTDVDGDKIRHTVGSARPRIFPVGEINHSVFVPFSGLRKRISAIAAEFRPDCVRAYNAHLQGLLGTGLSEELGIPFAVSLHINPEKDIRAFLNPFLSPSRWFFWRLNKYFIEPYVLEKADRIICAYNFVREFAKGVCKNHNKIETIYNRIDMEQFKPAVKPNSNGSGIRILCVGRLFERKNPEYLIRAMPKINAELLVIGDGPYRKRLDKIINALKLRGKVSIIPSVPNEEIHKYYQAADIFVSVNDYGGISKVVIEAMACGLPIVVKQPLWEESPEFLQDAVMVNENSPGAFIRALNGLTASSSLRADLGNRNRKKALEIEGSIMEQREMAIYRDLIYRR